MGLHLNFSCLWPVIIVHPLNLLPAAVHFLFSYTVLYCTLILVSSSVDANQKY